MARSFLVYRNKPSKGRFGLLRKGFYCSLQIAAWRHNRLGSVRKFVNDWYQLIEKQTDYNKYTDSGLWIVTDDCVYTNLIPKSMSYSNLSKELPNENHELVYTIQLTAHPSGKIPNGIQSIKYNIDRWSPYRSDVDNGSV